MRVRRVDGAPIWIEVSATASHRPIHPNQTQLAMLHMGLPLSTYLLQRMESYDGVTILATNLRSNLDAAFTRRLQFVVDIPFPEEEDRLRISEGQLALLVSPSVAGKRSSSATGRWPSSRPSPTRA